MVKVWFAHDEELVGALVLVVALPVDAVAQSSNTTFGWS